MRKVYLDDLRTPIDPTWVVVRDYSSFVKRIEEIGLENITEISLDHDLGDSAMHEYFTNVSPNYSLNYDNIKEKTGYDCAKWLVEHYYQLNPNLDESRFERKNKDFKFPKVYTHSANPIGSANIMGYINNFLMNEARPQTCVRTQIPHII
jgi:hypothetical protein